MSDFENTNFAKSHNNESLEDDERRNGSLDENLSEFTDRLEPDTDEEENEKRFDQVA